MLHKPKQYTQKQHTHEFCRHKEVKLEEQGVCLATPTTIQGGVAEVTWQYYLVDADVPPDSDPGFFFSAHSAWCQFEKSSSATIELVRPKLESPEWQNADGTTTKGLVGEVLTMSVTCTDMEEGAGVSFAVHHTGDSIVTATPVAQLGATVSGGKAEVTWTYQYKHDSDNPLTEKPSFFFAAKAQRVAPIKSADLEVSAEFKITICTEKKVLAKQPYILYKNEQEHSRGKTDDEGKISETDLIPDTYFIQFISEA